MKAKVKSSEIGRALKLCCNAIDAKDSVRSNVQFECFDNELKILATNTQYTIEYKCNAEIEEEGIAVVDGKLAHSVISKANGDCTIFTDDKNLIVKANGRTKLPNVAHGLPIADEIDGKKTCFDAVEFKNAINKVFYAISEDQSRIILTGAHIETCGPIAVITSLDGFRLAQTDISYTGDGINIVVPARILQAVCDAVISGNLEIKSNGTRVSFVGDAFVINAVTLVGDYIDTARIIPKDFSANVLVNTLAFKHCLESSTVASGSSNLVRLSIGDDKLSVSSNSQEAEFVGDVDVSINGVGCNIAFNLKYLINAVNHIDTEQCVIKLNSPISPVIISPYADNMTDIHLLLPVRTFN